MIASLDFDFQIFIDFDFDFDLDFVVAASISLSIAITTNMSSIYKRREMSPSFSAICSGKKQNYDMQSSLINNDLSGIAVNTRV